MSGGNVFGIYLGAILAIGVILVALGVSLVMYQRRFLALHREYAKKLILAHEEERAYVAREVHDDALQRVALLQHDVEQWAASDNGAASEREQTRSKALRGELEDLAAVAGTFGATRIVLAGFSFGAALAGQLAQRVKPERMVLVGVAATNFEVPRVPPNTLVIHGERDETIPLAAVLDWARPQELPVVLVPDADHFFHRKLNVLRSIVHRCSG